MPTHMKFLAVVLIATAVVILLLSLNALIPRGVPPAPSLAPAVSTSASGSPLASPASSP
ncbi:MAG TPA: hypothetical protein VKU60_17175 [Chloroflexota bacterium]|nr:hypothetical protein [Chloroflexota bacterium]